MGEAGRTSAGGSRVNGKWRVFVLFAVLTVALAYPLSIRPGSTLLDAGNDIKLYMWTLAWDVHAFTTQPLSIFDANIFHPQPLTLAYSENLISSAFFAAPVLWLGGNPVLALNLTTLMTCVLCGLGAYVLARRVGISPLGGVIAGLVFAFSPPRFFRISQMHLTAVQWIPFSLASLHAYLDHSRRRDLWLAVGFFTLQVLASGHGAVYLVVAILGLLVYRAVLGEPLAIGRRLRDLGIPGVVLLLPVAAVLVPYRRVQVEVGLVRTLDPRWWPTPESFLASPTRFHEWLHSFLPGTPVNELASAFLFPGILPLMLMTLALTLAATPGPRRHAGRAAWRAGALAAEITLILSAAVATLITLSGPLRIRIGGALLFSARSPERAWIFVAATAAIRTALTWRVPLAIGPRLRVWRTALGGWPSQHRQNAVPFYALLTLLGFLLAVGPPLGLWAYVYWLPGMNFIRVPSRFILLAMVGIAILAGFGYERLSARITARHRPLLALALGMLLVLEFAGVPLRTVTYEWRIPGVDRWLARQPRPFVVAEIPVKPAEFYHTTYMLHSTAHWQRTVHGYSGIRPALHDELYEKMRSFPDEPSLRSLADLGVTYVVVHADLYPQREQWPEVEKRLGEYTDWLRLEYEEGPGRVYSLHQPGPGNAP